MSKKYIAQVQSNNFVYPNNELFEYDQEILHNLNNNMVSGNVTNFVAFISNDKKSLVITFDYQWLSNGAEPMILPNGELSVMSLHLMTPDKQYYKPWMLIDNVTYENTEATGVTGNVSYSYSNGNILPEGLYVFEFRFIGHRCILPITANVTLHYNPLVTPTPSPSPGTIDCNLSGNAIIS